MAAGKVERGYGNQGSGLGRAGATDKAVGGWQIGFWHHLVIDGGDGSQGLAPAFTESPTIQAEPQHVVKWVVQAPGTPLAQGQVEITSRCHQHGNETGIEMLFRPGERGDLNFDWLS